MCAILILPLFFCFVEFIVAMSVPRPSFFISELGLAWNGVDCFGG